MDYENFCSNIRRLKDTLEKYHVEEERIYNENIRFLEELKELANFKKITMDNREFLLEVLAKKNEGTSSENKNMERKYKYVREASEWNTYSLNDGASIKETNESLKSNANIINDRVDTPIKSTNEASSNSTEHNSEEENAMSEFMENYNNGKLAPTYECLTVADEWADKLSVMDIPDWAYFPEKDKITLVRGDREKYYAYRAVSGKRVYFLVPKGVSLSGIQVIQNAFPTFFDFNLEECTDTIKTAKVIRPAIVVEENNEFKLYINKYGKKYKGIIEF